MNIEEYNFLALRTAPDCDQLNSNLTHAALGIAGEAGEIVDTIKKWCSTVGPLTVLH